MARSKSDTRSVRPGQLAARQHGLVTRQAAVGCRVHAGGDRPSDREGGGCIRSRAASMRSDGHPERPEQRWMAAVLACGEGAVLSHRSAAALWGIGNGAQGSGRSHRAPDVRETPAARDRTSAAVPRLLTGDVTNRDGIPVTTPGPHPRSTLRPTRRRCALERAVNEADKRDLIDPEELRDSLDRLRRRARRARPAESCSIATPFGSPIPISRSSSGRSPIAPDCRSHAPNSSSTASRSTSTGPSSASWSRRTASAITAPRRLRPGTSCATRPTSPPASPVLRFTHWQVKYEPAQVRSILERTARHLPK